jgi:hypothetical protein
MTGPGLPKMEVRAQIHPPREEPHILNKLVSENI